MRDLPVKTALLAALKRGDEEGVRALLVTLTPEQKRSVAHLFFRSYANQGTQPLYGRRSEGEGGAFYKPTAKPGATGPHHPAST